MKAAATAARTVRGGRPAATRQGQRRSSGGVDRSDGRERQAEERGERFVRGGLGLGHGLARAPAAAFDVPASVGRPLPIGLRGALETAFDADLAALRVHADAPAAAAAQALRAKAFASGSHLVFNAGFYRPETGAGRRLIAHELVHALQQTGRASHRGRLRVTEAIGDAAPQRDALPGFDVLKAAHAPKKTGGDYDAIAAEIGALLKAPNPSAAVDAYAQGKLLKLKVLKWPAQAESLLYDVCKSQGLYDLAAQMIERDGFMGGVRIQTIAKTDEVMRALESRNKGWAVYAKAIAGIDWLKAYETAWLARFEELVMGGGAPAHAFLPRSNSKPGAGTTIVDHLKDLLKQLQDDTAVSTNEWVFGGLLLMNDLDGLRYYDIVALYNASLKAAGDKGRWTFEAQRACAQGVIDWGARLQTRGGEFANVRAFSGDPKASDASLKPYLRGLGERVSAIGKKALGLWKQAVSVEDMVAPKKGEKAVAAALMAVRERAGRLGQDKGLPTLLADTLNDLSKDAKAGGRALTAAEYRERVKSWLQKFDDFSAATVGGARVVAFHSGGNDEVLAWIALDAFVLRLRSHLGWMASDNVDMGGGKRGAALSTSEAVLFWRIHLASWVKVVSAPLGWSTTAADAILNAKLEARSVLAIDPFDDGEVFKRFNMADQDTVQKARADFGQRPLRGLEPLTLDTLALFYRLEFYRQFAAQLNLMRPHSNAAEQASLLSATPYLAADAKRLVPTQPPQRWYSLRSQFAKKDSDPRDFSAVLQARDDFKELVRLHKPAGFSIVTPIGPGSAFAWFIPPYDGITTLMRESKVFQGLVAATFTGADTKTALKQQEGLLDDAWRGRLATVVHERLKDPAFRKKAWPAMVKQLYETTSREYGTATADFRVQFKWAMRRDRQLIARRLAVLWGRYDRRDRRVTQAVLDEFTDFSRANAALEYRDGEMQTALLMLETASEMQSALAKEERFGMVFTMLGYTEQAFEYVKLLAKLPAAQRTILLPDHENTDVWIARRTAQLKATIDHLKTVREHEQRKLGFVANREKGQIETFVKLSRPLPVGTPMWPHYSGLLRDRGGDGYVITEVKRSFIFHPAYGDAPTALDARTRTGYAKAQFLELDGITAIADSEPLLQIQRIEEVPSKDKDQPAQIRRKGKLITLTAKDEAVFEDLQNAITWAGFASAMERIQSAIEAIINMYLDLAELIPGVGPAIAAARIAGAVTMFLTSGDFGIMVDAINGGLKSVVRGLMDALTGKVSADEIILLVLFGDPRLDMLLAKSTLGIKGSQDTPEAAKGGGQFGSLKKVMTALRRLGRAVFRALRGLEGNVQRPMQDMRIFASTRPVLSFVLQFAAAHIFEIVAMMNKISLLIAERENAAGNQTVIASIERDLRDQQQNLGVKIHGAIESLAGFKLPHTIIDITPAFAAVMTMAETYVAGRIGYVGKLLGVVLKDSGALDLINTYLAEAMVDAGADPNIYWRETIIPQIETRFNDSRDAFVEQLNALLGKPALAGFFDPIEPVSRAKVEADPSRKFPETDVGYMPSGEEQDLAPRPSMDRPLIPNAADLPEVGAGDPIPAAPRRRLEAGMGQDFGHVRLHDNAVGQKMTDAFGADALTSGSHVFLRRGKMADAMDHELAHVVQQTGSRPLGRSHGTAPVTGHPERGLNWNPADEAEAGEVAAAMRSGGGVRLGGRGKGGGLQPKGVNWLTVARMMREVSDLDAVTAASLHTASLALGSGKAAPTKDVQAIVDSVLGVLLTKSNSAAPWKKPRGAFID
ncbi:MAG TPA: DUF4157 domain-containing protein, partial [Reyranella sp.]|nr:DUF4157 domain-containing protein [Reyranella sp.]